MEVFISMMVMVCPLMVTLFCFVFRRSRRGFSADKKYEPIVFPPISLNGSRDESIAELSVRQDVNRWAYESMIQKTKE